MKKKFLSLISAVVLTMAMSVTAFAAESQTAADVVAATASGQEITAETLDTFVATTTLSTDVEGATITVVSTAQAATLVAQANAIVGSNASIATMVDINVPEGTGTATFTLGVPSLVSGQSVSVLHLKSDGTVEALPVSDVANGSVTFTMSSYSPVAVVVNAVAPKTNDVNGIVVMLIAVAGLAGAYAFGKKAVRA